MLQVTNRKIVGNELEPVRLSGLDTLGVVLSTACLIHCTILPIFLALLPVLGSHFQLDEKWHFLITALVVPTAMIALVNGWTHHRHNAVLWLGAIGLIFVLVAPLAHEAFGHAAEMIICGIGGTVLVSAHLKNRKFNRAVQGCRCCAE